MTAASPAQLAVAGRRVTRSDCEGDQYPSRDSPPREPPPPGTAQDRGPRASSLTRHVRDVSGIQSAADRTAPPPHCLTLVVLVASLPLKRRVAKRLSSRLLISQLPALLVRVHSSPLSSPS